MKKKIALLLAGAMTLSSLPVNVFANINRADTSLSRNPVLAAPKTVLVQPGANTGASGQITNNRDVDYWTTGMYFQVDLRESNPAIGAQFEVSLQNAEWFFGENVGNNVNLLVTPNQWDGSVLRVPATATSPAYELRVNANRTTATVTITGAPTGAAAVDTGLTGAQRQELTQVRGEIQAIQQGAVAADRIRLEAANAANAVDDNSTDAHNAVVLAINSIAGFNATVEAAHNIAANIIEADRLARQEGVTALNAAATAAQRFTEGVFLVSDFQAFLDNPTDAEPAVSMRVILNELIEGEGDLVPGGGADASETAINNVLTAPANATIINSLAPATTANTLAARATTAVSTLETIRDAGNLSAADINAINGIIENIGAGSTPVVGRIVAGLTGAHTALTTTPVTLADLSTVALALGNVNTQSGLAIDALDGLIGTTTPVNGNITGRISIPLVIRTLNNNNVTVEITQTSGFAAQTERRAVTIGTEEGSTTTRITNPETSRNSLDISPISVSENRVGALPVNGAFEIQAPSGFRFTTVNNYTNPGLRVTGGLPSQPATFAHNIALNTNGTVLSVRYTGLVQSTALTGALAIHGYQLVPTNVDTVREGEVRLNIRNVRANEATINGTVFAPVTGDTVTAQSFLAGTIADWDVNLTVVGSNNVPELVNGRLDGIERTSVNDNTHRAATVRFEETVESAWWANRTTTFTLPEGVRVRQLEFRNIRNITNNNDLSGTFYNDRNRNSANVRVNDNVITLTGLNTNGRAAFDMDLWLNIESGFTGNIELTLGGSGVTGNNRNEDQSVVIATAINPVRIEAETTNVRIGYQFVPVGNFRIIETVPGALAADEQVFISVTDNYSNDMHIASGFNWEITEGDLQVRNVRTGTNLNLNNNNRNNDVNVSFEISRQSTRASVIEFTNVQVRLSNNAPISNHDAGYDLVVWGPAVAANFDGVRPNNASGVNIENDRYINSNDFFRTAGIRANYINVGSSAGFGTNVVRVTEGSNVIVVGDQEMTMDTAAYISTASDSMMVPVRFVSMALGIPANNVMWSPETSTATIRAGETILQFQTNSSVMRINGIEVPILNANGEAVQSEVRDDRAFIPFRALGEALGIYVDWDAETSTAIFDPTRQPQNSLFAA